MAQETREFAEEVARAIAYYCPERPIVFNVGAENGFEADIIQASVPCSVVYRFEPNHGGDGSRWFSLLVGATNGPTDFYFRTDTPAESSTYYRTATEKVTREQVRLDTWAEANGIGIVDALFIDTEGTTLDVLVGAGELLCRVSFICAEVQVDKLYGENALVGEVEEYLAGYGLVRVPGGYPGGGQENRFYARKTS